MPGSIRHRPLADQLVTAIDTDVVLVATGRDDSPSRIPSSLSAFALPRQRPVSFWRSFAGPTIRPPMSDGPSGAVAGQSG